MNVFLLCNSDLTTNLVFSGLFAERDVKVVGIAFTTTLTKSKGGFAGIFSLLKKMDARYWTYLVFTNGCFRLFERLVRPKKSPRAWPFSLVSEARRRHLPVYHSDNFNSDEFLRIVRDAKPDLLLIRVNQILSPELLNVPALGTWCLHSSLLPAYKGIAGEFHALLNGETALGSTLFEVVPKLDQGPPLVQVELPVLPKKSLFFHMIQNNLSASKMVADSVAELARTGRLASKLSAGDRKPSYFTWPQPSQVARFSKSRPLITISEAIDLLFRSLF